MPIVILFSTWQSFIDASGVILNYLQATLEECCHNQIDGEDEENDGRTVSIQTPSIVKCLDFKTQKVKFQVQQKTG